MGDDKQWWRRDAGSGQWCSEGSYAQEPSRPPRTACSMRYAVNVDVCRPVDVSRQCQFLKFRERLRDPRRIRRADGQTVPPPLRRDRHASLDELRHTATYLWARVNAVRNFYRECRVGPEPVVSCTVASRRWRHCSMTGSRRRFRRLAAAGRRARRPGSWHASTRPATLRICAWRHPAGAGHDPAVHPLRRGKTANARPAVQSCVWSASCGWCSPMVPSSEVAHRPTTSPLGIQAPPSYLKDTLRRAR